MPRAFVRFWARASALGLFLCLPVAVALVLLPLHAHPENTVFVWVELVFCGIAILNLFWWYIYAFPMMVLHDQGLMVALRNAMGLSSRHFLSTGGMLTLFVLLALLTLLANSGLLFVSPAVWGVFILNNARMQVAKELSK